MATARAGSVVRDDEHGLAVRRLDLALRRLAAAEGRGRHLLGRLAARLLDRRGHHRLGFVRLADYARERLGRSGREVQELARVARGLARLPVVSGALAAGDISWSHARLLVGLATPETEREWVSRAVGLGVRELAVAARRDADEAAPDDGEPRARFHVGCPRPVRRLWRRTAELASRMAGASLPAWRAAEAIVAESVADGFPLEARPRRAARDPAPEPAAAWAALRDGADPFASLAEDAERLSDPHQLDASLRAVLHVLQRLDAELGETLTAFAERRLYRVFGLPTLEAYVRERLGCSVRRARALIAIERRARTLRPFGDAYRDGRLSYARALVLLPVLTPATAAAWVTRAQQVTVRRLVALVDWALEVERPGVAVPPPAAEGPLELPPDDEVHTCARGAEVAITFEGPVSVVALLWAAIRSRTPRGAPSWQGLAALLMHAKSEWERQPRHRDPIFERDGWRCAVPACTSRAQLHDHHVVYRSRGGDHGGDNRVTVCAAHHLRGIHGGTIRVTGRAPDRLVWAVGCRAEGPPLFRTRGDRYVRGGM
jgi:hypothetical protein